MENVGWKQYCPQCKKVTQTTCCACGCGNCLECNYRFSCYPIDDPINFGTPANRGNLLAQSSSVYFKPISSNNLDNNSQTQIKVEHFGGQINQDKSLSVELLVYIDSLPSNNNPAQITLNESDNRELIKKVNDKLKDIILSEQI